MAALVFGLCCSLVVLWAIQLPRRMLSCPFQVAATASFFILPQTYVLIVRPGLVPRGGVDTYCWYGTLCVLAAFLGYHWPISSRRSRIDLDEGRLAFVAAVTGAAGFGGWAWLQYFLATVGVDGLWRGLPVYLYTLSKFVLPGLALFRLLHLRTRKPIYLTSALVLLIPVAAQCFLNGKRSWAFMLVFCWFFPLVLMKRVRVQRFGILVGCVLAFFVVVFFPAYRTQVEEKGLGRLPEIVKQNPPSRVLTHYFSGKQTLEVRDACVLFALVNRTGEHSYGALQWNGLVHRYFPGGLLGYEWKESLKFPVPDYDRALVGMHEWIGLRQGGEVKFYTTKTGFFDSYAEFWVFGAGMYFALGVVFRSLEDGAFVRRDMGAILALCFFGFLPSAVVYAEWNFAWTVYLPPIVLWWLTLRYANLPLPDVWAMRSKRTSSRTRELANR